MDENKIEQVVDSLLSEAPQGLPGKIQSLCRNAAEQIADRFQGQVYDLADAYGADPDLVFHNPIKAGVSDFLGDAIADATSAILRRGPGLDRDDYAQVFNCILQSLDDFMGLNGDLVKSLKW